MAQAPRASVGFECQACPDLNLMLDECCQAGFQFLCAPIVNPRFEREGLHEPAKLRPGPFTRTDLLLTGSDWSSLIVGKFSPWIQLDGAVNDTCRRNSEIAFRQEMAFMTHLGLPAILFPLKSADCANLAKHICEFMHNGPDHMYWIRVPLRSSRDCLDDVFESTAPPGGSGEHQSAGAPSGVKAEPACEDPWRWWSKLRTMCDNNKRLTAALELTADLPSEEHLIRWTGEPVKVVIIPTSIFLTNKKGFPVLPRAHQSFIKRMMQLNVQFIITGTNRHGDKGYRSYVQYLDFMVENQPEPDSVTKYAKGYEDYLQSPLQPLMDNLESQTYEIFEKDPFKYRQYQESIHDALMDRVPDEEKQTRTTTIMVVGAGRGPLVKAALRAAKQADRKVHLYAVEKNPNAVVTLEGLKEEEWGELVTVVSSDMRQWEAPVKADILVSELLGSFGDNELSPECLDGAQRFLKDDGLSIPSSYTSFISPIMSEKLHNEVRFAKDKEKHPDAPFETPYVVRLHNHYLPVKEPEPLFTFVHPNRDKTIDNNRYKYVDFTIPEDCVIHGIAGYFDSVLYKSRTMCIVPQRRSPGMFSWFPMLFPIKTPMEVRAGEKLRVHFWRIVSDKNVWYEWCVSEPRTTPVHNPKGRSYTIGL